MASLLLVRNTQNDWHGMYVDGALKYEGSEAPTASDILVALGQTGESRIIDDIDPDSGYPLRAGNLPK